MKKMQITRRLGTAVAVMATAGLVACNSTDLLEVDNPGLIDEEFLAQTTSIPALTATIIGDFNRYFTSQAYATAILSDEAITGHNFFQWQEFDRRIVDPGNSVLPDIYEPPQIARGTAERIIARLRELLPGAGATDLRLAQSLAYQGFNFLNLATTFCGVPVAPNEPSRTPDELFQMAIERFNEAITIANAAPAGQTFPNTMTKDNVLALARLGAARAYLNLGNNAQAVAFASLVPASFTAWVVHNEASGNAYQYNPLFGNILGAGVNHNLGVAAPFRVGSTIYALTGAVSQNGDPRVRMYTGRRGHNQRTTLFSPRQGEQYENWVSNNAQPADYTRDTDVRFATGLEAQYIVAEAQGLTPTNLTFVNTRRAVGGFAALPNTTTAAEYRLALLDQMGRDFYLTNMRLGALRRFKKLYGIDMFPTGTHEDSAYGQYGTAECYVPHIDEFLGTAP